MMLKVDKKPKVNYKIEDVTTWLKNHCNRYIAQYNMRNIT